MIQEVDSLDISACCVPNAASVRDIRCRLIPSSTARTLAELFKALGDPTRVRILSVLADAEVCVGDLSEALELGQSAVSHQLHYLRELRLVRARRDGKHVYYKLDDAHVRSLFEQGLQHVVHE